MTLSDYDLQSMKTMRTLEKLMVWKKYANSTRSSYILWTKKYLSFHEPYGDPKTCEEPPIRDFITFSHNKKPLTYSSTNVILSALTYLYEQVYQVPKKKALFIRAKTPYEITPTVGETKILRIISELPSHYNRLAKIIYYTGMTSKEATTLEWKSISLSKESVKVRGRILPLPEKAIEVLSKCPRGEWVFPSVKDSRSRVNPCLDVSGFNRALHVASRKCGLRTKDKINARSIRNIYALLELKKGVSPFKVQESLGTTNQNVMFMYMDLKNDLDPD